ncbi:MAG TPA: metallophosphoesterase [Mycobacteriales bacterium]|nr:metallophosphoesterase [Mycobacteriales bacterium]
MIRVAAVGDVHLGGDACGHLRPALEELPQVADVLLLAGDLTRHGTVDEAECVAAEFRDLGVPVIAVLGNHDYHSDQQEKITELLTDAGLSVLEGESTVVTVGAERLAVAGVKGFGLGFAGRSCSDFGEPESKAFAGHGKQVAARLARALDGLAGEADRVVALSHYSPVADTLLGEPPEIYAFLGNYLLAEAIDAADVDLAVHGHAHAGTEKGVTAGGTRVRNVAQPVLRRAYAVYDL